MKINTSKYRKTLLTGCVSLMCTLSGTSHAAGGQIYHTIGAPELSVSNLGESGGLLFEVRFEPASVVGADGTLIDNPYAFEGDILARSVAADGSFTPDDYYPSNPDDAGYIEGLAGKIENFNGLWRGSETVTSQSKRGAGVDDRVIFTSGYDAGGDIGYPFRWSELSDAIKGVINSDTSVNEASDPVTDWTRGHDTNEGTGATNFRQRTTVLGNFVHVTPAYLGAPFGVFPNDADYGQFVTDNQARTPLVFAGDGAGMMRAFKASDGIEVFAYIPQEILGSLKTLTQQTSEIFLVDGSPTIGDAKAAFPKCGGGDCWRTVLVSGLGVGGSTIFSLDVTDPVSDIGSLADKESNAAELFLWEFTDADLSLTTAEPIIAQLNDTDGTWVAIFGNGQGADKTVLYVVDIADGSLIQKLIVSPTGSGLSSPVAWDLDYDGDIDIVYAGDLEGNLWKFDFTSADVNGNASIAFSGNSLVQVIDPDTNNPLPITTKPSVSINPSGGLLVFFGTGTSNQDIGDTNALFGIKDKGVRITNPTLIESVLSEPILYDPVDPNEPNKKYRVIKEYTEPATTSVGWKLVLPTGERILTNLILNNERVGFTSTDPAAATFNQNWFTAVDYQTGGPPDTAFLDLNNDGIFNDDDLFRDLDGECPIDDETCIANSDSAIAVGIFLDIGVVSAPTPANISGQKDTVFITHGLESIFDTPLEDELFNDPGIRAGHIDHDTFEEENGSLRDHTHEYDDKYNVNGVNMLVSGGQVLHPPDSFIWNGAPPGQTPVESATGIMSSDKALMDHVLELDDAENTLAILGGHGAAPVTIPATFPPRASLHLLKMSLSASFHLMLFKPEGFQPISYSSVNPRAQKNSFFLVPVNSNPLL